MTPEDASIETAPPAPEAERQRAEPEPWAVDAHPRAAAAEPQATEGTTAVAEAEPHATQGVTQVAEAEPQATEAVTPIAEAAPQATEGFTQVAEAEPQATEVVTQVVEFAHQATEAVSQVAEAEPQGTGVATGVVAAEPQATEVVTQFVEADGQATEVATQSPHADTPVEDGSGVLAPDVRRRLVERFEAWVDRMAAGEPPPPGLPRELLAELATDDEPPTAGDLYAVFAGLTGLTGETRLQGRAFKHLADVLAPLNDLPRQVEQLAASLEQSTADDDDDAGDAALPSAKAALEVLLDLYDRLGRGLQNADAALATTGEPDDRGWLARLRGPASPAGPTVDAVQAMRDGYALTLSRVTAALHQWDVEPIGQVGEPFDPRRMVAIDVRAGGEHPSGTVCEVNRSGCSVRGTVLTAAQVTVVR